MDVSRALDQRSTGDRIDPQIVESSAGADDICDRILRPNLVKSHVFGRDSMHPAFGDSYPSEDSKGKGLYSLVK